MGNLPPSGDELTTSQVAEMTGWSITSINRWASSGELLSRKLPGRTGARLFARADIDAFRALRGELVPSP